VLKKSELITDLKYYRMIYLF